MSDGVTVRNISLQHSIFNSDDCNNHQSLILIPILVINIWTKVAGLICPGSISGKYLTYKSAIVYSFEYIFVQVIPRSDWNLLNC